MAAAPINAVPEQTLAQLAGVSVVTWRKHRAMGAPTPRSKDALDEWRDAYAQWREDNGQGQRRAGGADNETLRWQRERMKWLALEKRWSVAAMAKQLVPRQQVIERTTQQILAVRQALNDMVRKLASRLFNAPSPESIEAELQREVDHILDGFAQGLEQISDDAGMSAIVGDDHDPTSDG